MTTYRIVFADGEQRELTVNARTLDGHKQGDRGHAYVFRRAAHVVAVVPKDKVLWIETVDGES